MLPVLAQFGAGASSVRGTEFDSKRSFNSVPDLNPLLSMHLSAFEWLASTFNPLYSDLYDVADCI